MKTLVRKIWFTNRQGLDCTYAVFVDGKFIKEYTTKSEAEAFIRGLNNEH